MSIQINKLKCVGCGKCIEACPGNLIKKDIDGKAFIKHVKDCWGCTSCLKECRFEAINFFLGADVGGKGSTLSFRQNGSINAVFYRKGQLRYASSCNESILSGEATISISSHRHNMEVQGND